METTTIFNHASSIGVTYEYDDICIKVLPLQISSLTFTFLAIPFLIYIISALCFFGFKMKLLFRCGGNSAGSKNRVESIIHSATVLSAVFDLPYVAIEAAFIYPPAAHFCNIYQKFLTIFFGLQLFCSYFALWYRVFCLFYRNPVMRNSMSKFAQVLTFVPLVLLIVTVIGNLTTFLLSPPYATLKCGCKAVQEKTANFYKWVILVFWTTAFQGALLFSFIYPLYLHRKKMLAVGFDQHSIIPVIKRAAIVAVVCVFCDITNSVFEILYRGDVVYLNHIFLSMNALINLLGVIATSKNWKKKLFPWQKQSYNLSKYQSNYKHSNAKNTSNKISAT